MEIFSSRNKKILVYDAGGYNPFHKYISKYGYNLFYKRGEQINLYIIFKCLFQLDISYFNYFKNYLEFSKPKIIITGIDNDPFFIQFRKHLKLKQLL